VFTSKQYFTPKLGAEYYSFPTQTIAITLIFWLASSDINAEKY